MFRPGLILSAVALYLIITLGCVVGSHEKAAANLDDPEAKQLVRLTGLPYRGVAMQIQRVDWIDEYKQAIDEMVAVGADSFLCVVDARQENGRSSKIYLDMRHCPTPARLGEVLDHAKSKGLRVILMPIVLLDNPRGNEWRGTINPESWADWFDSYQGMMHHFAWIAQSHKVDVLVVGSELVSSEVHADEWRKTISSIRETFKGALTYSSNWDHYWDIPFWNQLDIIGMNSYWKLGEGPNATVDEIAGNWKKIQKDLKAFSDKMGKPILLLEAGWCSLSNAAHEPWDYTRDSLPVDLDLQKRLWQGFFQAWHGTDWMAGFMIWAWEPGDAGPKDKGYCPKGKPAYKVIKDALAKPWNQK